MFLEGVLLLTPNIPKWSTTEHQNCWINNYELDFSQKWIFKINPEVVIIFCQSASEALCSIIF